MPDLFARNLLIPADLKAFLLFGLGVLRPVARRDDGMMIFVTGRYRGAQRGHKGRKGFIVTDEDFRFLRETI